MGDTDRAAADLIEFIAKSIVSQPDDVRVKTDGDMLQLETADDDRGRVIGRQGRVAKAMRAVLAASRPGAASRLDIVD